MWVRGGHTDINTSFRVMSSNVPLPTRADTVSRRLTLLRSRVKAYASYTDSEGLHSLARTEMRSALHAQLTSLRLQIQGLGETGAKSKCLARQHYVLLMAVTACDDVFFRTMYAALPPLPIDT